MEENRSLIFFVDLKLFMWFFIGCEFIFVVGIEGGKIMVLFNKDGIVFLFVCLY